ncbi:MAG: hypothetical protein KGJ13_02450 [Patescibacteria group bacterium]|nr:hypothetical protein [Patescibacteria group bacterium]
MAVGTLYAPSKQAGNGVLLAFSGNWKAFNESDFVVYTINAAGIQSAQLVLNTDYTVVFDTDAETWTVTFTVAPVSGGYALIERSTSLTQETNWPREEATPSEDTENAVDKLTLIAQELLWSVTNGTAQPSVEQSGTQAAMPANPTAIVWYYQTDTGQYLKYLPAAQKWFLVG